MVEKGKKVKIEYTGTLDNGDVFDSSEKHGQPLEFEVGAGQVIKGFDDAVSEMEVGEERDIEIHPAMGYGQPNPELVKEVPRDKFPAEENPQAGMFITLQTPQGQQIPATIKDVKEDAVVVDFNHPLAGKTLHFKLKVLEAS